MTEQKRFQDEMDVDYQAFFQKVVNDYNLDKISKGQLEVKSRGVSNGLTSETDIPKIITDNKVHELVVCDRVVACVYCRRDNANWTEATYIVVEQAIASILTNNSKKQA